MKVWKAAELVELDVRETANGQWDGTYEYVVCGTGYNNSLLPDTGNDSDTNISVTPDTIS